MTSANVLAQDREAALWRAVEMFQREEILLLQEGQYDAWLQLMTEDVRYWMPMVSLRERREDMVSGEGGLAFFDDNLASLTIRIKRFQSGKALEQSPPSRVRYYIQNLRLTPNEDGSEVRVLSNFLIYQNRLEKQEYVFMGEREDVLRCAQGTWKLAFRKATLDRNVLGASSLHIFF
jgi:3-phenylpropionate/cinnamic acid dioxygenase small subunit